MFDEACYNTAWGTMDSDFRQGRYNVVRGSPRDSYLAEDLHAEMPAQKRNPFAETHSSSTLPLHRLTTDRNPIVYGSTGRLNSPSSRAYIASRANRVVPLVRNPPSYPEDQHRPNKYHSTSNLYHGGADRAARYGGAASGAFGGDRRLIFDGSTSEERRSESRNEWKPEKDFLSEIQRELEHQRRNLSGEVDKLLLPMNDLNIKQTPIDADKNSFVDTSSGKPIFKAFVDVSEYPEESLKIRLDPIAKKIIVEAGQVSNNSRSPSSTFTQKIALPKYADETKMDAKLNNKGIIKIEIPLLFYFPEDELRGGGTVDRKSKTFVNGVVSSNPDGRKEVEIVVKIGNEINPSEVRVEVLRDKLIVYSQRGDQKRVINTYRLPPGADVTGITSRRHNDGHLVVRVPVGGK